MAEPLAILGGAYTDDTRPLSSQDTCNYILFPAEKAGTRTEGQLIDAPGLIPFAGVGDGPHRGARDVEGKLFIVSGNKLYQVATTGVATELGTIPGTGRVSMTHNQIANGNELLIGTRDNSYIWNTSTSALTATGVPLFSVDFLNNLFLGIDPGRRFWRYSGLADGTSWNTLDNESAESSPDRIIGGIVSQGEWLVFGERTIEVWTHSPTSSTAFQRSVVIERGCISPETIVRLDNSVIFLGNDNILYRLEGYSPRPISTHTLTREWGKRDPQKAFAFTYEDAGRVVYYLTHKDGKTFGYDITTGEWHRRESYGFNRWRLNTLFKWNGEWYGGDFADGTLWRLDWRYMKEGCDEMVRYRRTGVLHGNQRPVAVNSVELILDKGRDVEVELDSEITITGSLPDGVIGEEIDYQYTITTAYPGQAYTLTVVGLPSGLTMSPTGHVTGEYEGEGVFTVTIEAADFCGVSYSLVDEVVVTQPIPIAWMLARQGNTNACVKFSPEGLDWSDAFASAPLDGGGFWVPDAYCTLVYSGGGILAQSNFTPSVSGAQKGGFYDGAIWHAADVGTSDNDDHLMSIRTSTHWLVPRASSNATASADGQTFSSIGIDLEAFAPIAAGVLALKIGFPNPNLINVYIRNDDGSADSSLADLSLGFAPYVPMLVSDGTTALLSVHRATTGPDYNIAVRYTTDGTSWTTVASPFADTVGIPHRVMHYGLGRYWITCNDRIAFGSTPAGIALDPFTFPQQINGIGDDGSKLIVCGDAGMLYSWTATDGWLELDSETTSNLIDVVALGAVA